MVLFPPSDRSIYHYTKTSTYLCIRFRTDNNTRKGRRDHKIIILITAWYQISSKFSCILFRTSFGCLAVLTLSIFLFSWAFPEYQQWVMASARFIIIAFLFIRSKLIPSLIERFLKHKSKVILIAFQSQVSHFLGNRSLIIALPLSLI